MHVKHLGLNKIKSNNKTANKMKVKEYLRALGIKDCSSINLTFLVCEVKKERVLAETLYRSTPIHTVWEWKEHNTMQEHIVLHTKVLHPAWLSGVDWNPSIESNRTMSLLVISREDMLKLYGEAQANHTEAFITDKIWQDIENGRNPWLQK